MGPYIGLGVGRARPGADFYNNVHFDVNDMVFKQLDHKTLAKTRLVSKDWKDYIDGSTTFWSNVSPLQYRLAAQEGRLDICRLIIQNTQDKNPWQGCGLSPLHMAAGKGHLEVCSLIIENLQNNGLYIPSD